MHRSLGRRSLAAAWRAHCTYSTDLPFPRPGRLLAPPGLLHARRTYLFVSPTHNTCLFPLPLPFCGWHLAGLVYYHNAATALPCLALYIAETNIQSKRSAVQLRQCTYLPCPVLVFWRCLSPRAPPASFCLLTQVHLGAGGAASVVSLLTALGPGTSHATNNPVGLGYLSPGCLASTLQSTTTFFDCTIELGALITNDQPTISTLVTRNLST